MSYSGTVDVENVETDPGIVDVTGALLMGPKGEKGDKGDKGDTGATGATGATGPQGPKGDPGDDGADGQDGQDGADGADGQDGADGYSPTVSVTDITGGHRVSVTDKNGTQTFDVMDGQDGTTPAAYTSNPAALGSASPGSATAYSRGDHVHAMPSAADVGAIAAPSSPSSGQFLVYNGSAWVAQSLSTWQGGSY